MIRWVVHLPSSDETVIFSSLWIIVDKWLKLDKRKNGRRGTTSMTPLRATITVFGTFSSSLIGEMIRNAWIDVHACIACCVKRAIRTSLETVTGLNYSSHIHPVILILRTMRLTHSVTQWLPRALNVMRPTCAYWGRLPGLSGVWLTYLKISGTVKLLTMPNHSQTNTSPIRTWSKIFHMTASDRSLVVRSFGGSWHSMGLYHCNLITAVLFKSDAALVLI